MATDLSDSASTARGPFRAARADDPHRRTSTDTDRDAPPDEQPSDHVAVDHVPSAAEQLGDMFDVLFGGAPPVPIEFWDGSSVGDAHGPGRIIVDRFLGGRA